jgi:hypothetical protein
MSNMGEGPAYRAPSGYVGLFTSNLGFLLTKNGVTVMHEQAYNADRDGTPVYITDGCICRVASLAKGPKYPIPKRTRGQTYIAMVAATSDCRAQQIKPGTNFTDISGWYGRTRTVNP